jgi:hypothetical protein
MRYKNKILPLSAGRKSKKYYIGYRKVKELLIFKIPDKERYPFWYVWATGT